MIVVTFMEENQGRAEALAAEYLTDNDAVDPEVLFGGPVERLSFATLSPSIGNALGPVASFSVGHMTDDAAWLIVLRHG